MPLIDLSTLSANAQQTMLDFYEFLQQKYMNKPVNLVAPVNQQQLSQADFKTFMMSIPKIDGIALELKRHD